MIWRAALLVICLAGTAAAQEYIRTDGPLADDDFYRLVSCAAPPGQMCSGAAARWDKPVIRVGMALVPPAYPARLGQEMSKALDRAIAQINGTTPALNLKRVNKDEAMDITIHLQPIRAGDLIRGTGRPEMDGVPIGAALVQIWWEAGYVITDAVIVLAADIPRSQAGPILLEELTQAMGLMTDIRNPYYDTRSVFSEDSNSVAKLGAQDRMALRRHYPAP